MRYYVINEPYYALIKAYSEDQALKKYVEVVADDYDGTLEEEIKEVTREVALITYARGVTEDGTVLQAEDIIAEFTSAEADVLLVDSCLL